MCADRWGKRYGQRPCALLRPNVRDVEVDAALDLLCMQAGIMAEVSAAKEGAIPVYVVGD